MKTFNYTTAMIRNPSTQKFESIPALSGGGNGDESGGTGTGNSELTKEQVESLYEIIKICAFTENPVEKIRIFEDAWGIETVKVPATGIELNKTELIFTSSEPQTLIATVTPNDSTDFVSWNSTSDAIATVDNGIVTPVSNGNCIIKATAGSYSYECNVEVKIAETYTVDKYIKNSTNVAQGYIDGGTEHFDRAIFVAEHYYSTEAVDEDTVVNVNFIADNKNYNGVYLSCIKPDGFTGDGKQLFYIKTIANTTNIDQEYNLEYTIKSGYSLCLSQTGSAKPTVTKVV